MKILMDCLLVFLSGFVFWQFVVIHEKGFWSCYLGFIGLTIASAVVMGLAILGGWFAFAKNRISFRNQMVGIFMFAVSLAVLFVELVPAWFNDGDVYGHESVKSVLLGELVTLAAIAVFGLVNLAIDLTKK